MESFLSSMRFSFLYVDRYSFSRTWVYPESKIPYCMLRYIVRGSAVFVIDDKEITVHENEIIYVPEGCTLSCRALDDNFTFISIRFIASVHLEWGDILADYYGVERITVCDDTKVYGYFEQVLKSAYMKNKSKVFRIRGNLELIIAYLSEKTTQAVCDEKEMEETPFSLERIRQRATKTNVRQDPRIQVVVDYLITNPTKSLDTQKLCEIATLSHTSLRRCFKEHTGKSLNEFIKELRMMTAARKILVTDERISIISYELGFEDPNYFSRSFKMVFGVSPQQYRKTARE